MQSAVHFPEETETEFWERLALRVDLQRALHTLTPQERALLDALLAGTPLQQAGRQLGIRNAPAVWHALQARLRAALSGYG
ncbi:MAG: hypothetical protein WHS44_10565 [Fimbriimonadales bacterium]|nr:MAG: hypothetical protein KatS3mg018_2259 [Fimbriimonadales bacterium]